MKQLVKHRLYERGAAHFVALILFVALVGIVGFVGYNAWQKQTSNAGGKATLGSLQNDLKKEEAKLSKLKKTEANALKAFNNKRKNEKKEDPEIAKLYTQLNKATKAASGLPSIDVLNQRVTERQAEVARMEGQVAEAVNNLAAARAAKDAAKAKNKAAKQAIVDDWKQKKDNREAKLADARTDLRKAQDKQAAQNAVNTLTAQINARRQTWKQWTALVQARANVQQAQSRVNDLKKQVAAKKNSAKPAPKPTHKEPVAAKNTSPDGSSWKAFCSKLSRSASGNGCGNCTNGKDRNNYDTYKGYDKCTQPRCKSDETLYREPRAPKLVSCIKKASPAATASTKSISCATMNKTYGTKNYCMGFWDVSKKNPVCKTSNGVGSVVYPYTKFTATYKSGNTTYTASDACRKA